MAEDLQAFLNRIGPEFDGKADIILTTTGASCLEEILELVDELDDLKDLYTASTGIKWLHVKKLYKAIASARENGGVPSVTSAKTEQANSPQADQTATTKAQQSSSGTPALSSGGFYPKLEKTVSSIPEGEERVGNHYVSCADASKHEDSTEIRAPLPAGSQSLASSADVSKVQSREAPAPLPSGPLLGQANVKRARETQIKKSFDATAVDADFPALPSAGTIPQITQEALQSTPARLALMAQLVAKEAENAAAEAANAAFARQMIDRSHPPKFQLSKEAFDRVIEFFWDDKVFKLKDGVPQNVGKSPISDLPEDEFRNQFLAALESFCQKNKGEYDWPTPVIEEYLVYEPRPASISGKVRPHVLVMFQSKEDVEYIEEIYRWYFSADLPSSVPIISINGQKLLTQRPSYEYVRRVASSKGSETGSQAGSENSHSSQIQSAYKNLTLLFLNIPDSVTASLAQRPAAKQAIEKYVDAVLAGSPELPISRSAVKFSASFSEPKRAPSSGCWLTFQYTLVGKKVSLDDGKAYSFEAFKALHKDKKTEPVILKMWDRATDAVHELEKKLGGESGRPMSIAKWFCNRVKEQKITPPGCEDKGKIWTDCIVSGKHLSVEFKR